MSLLATIAIYVVPFLVILSIVVFVHEFGHYVIARCNGVRIDVFSIGFGPELFGFNDRAGTRWKFSALPLGGYVKMYGDADPTSSTIDLKTWPEPSRSSSSASCSRPSAARSPRPRSARFSPAAPPRPPACSRATGSSRPTASRSGASRISRAWSATAREWRSPSRSSARVEPWT
jgi:membrane-associated protease RseP (regulator of RpoE activity)